ncbi:conserved hypothetical protein [Tenacibaculum sediminilitoris]
MPFLDKGILQIGLSYDYNNLNTLNEGSKKLKDNSRLRTTNSVLLNLSYNFSQKFLIEALLTWVNQSREITSSFGDINVDETFGIGDGILLLRYMVLNNEVSSLTLGLGKKIPLGSTAKRNNQGILLNADLQPGSNAFDLVFTSRYSRSFNFRKSMNFSLRGTYRNTGVNNSYLGNNKYEFGNELQLYLGVSDSYLLWKQLISPSITFKYRKAGIDRINSNSIANTGGEWLFFNPSILFFIKPTISFYLKSEIPFYSNVKGTQLTPTYRFNTGIVFQVLNKKKNHNLIN